MSINSLGYSIGVTLLLALAGISLPLPAFADELAESAPAAPAPVAGTSGFHLSALAGFGYGNFYETALYSGFVEMRVGGRMGPIELTGRLQLGFGATEHGLDFVKPTLGVGLLGQIHPRIRLGFELSPPTSSGLAVLRVSRGFDEPTMIMSILEFSPEVQLDLIENPKSALFLSALPGFLVGVSSSPPFVSPSIRVGLGYRFF